MKLDVNNELREEYLKAINELEEIDIGNNITYQRSDYYINKADVIDIVEELLQVLEDNLNAKN